MSASPIDYAAIAKQYGAVSSSQPGVDYGAIAKQFGAVDSQPAGQQAPPDKPGYLKRLGQSFGIPTSQAEAQAVMPKNAQDLVGMLNPGSVAAKLLTNYGQTAAKGFKEGFQESVDAGQNTRQLAQQGRLTPSELLKQGGKVGAAAMHSGLQALPFIGPTLENYGSDISQGNYAGAAGSGTGIAAQIAGPKLVETGLPYAGEGIARTGGALTRNAEPIGNTLGYGGAAVTAGSELLHGRPVSAGATALLSPLAANRAIKLTRVAGGGLQDLGNAIGRTPRPIEGPAPRPTAAPVQPAAPAESAPMGAQPQAPPQSPAPESPPVQSPANATAPSKGSMEGYYGKTAGKSNLKGNQRQLAGPTSSTAPNPSIPVPQAPHPQEIMDILNKPGMSDADLATVQNYFAQQRLANMLRGGAAKQQPGISLGDMLQRAVGQ